MKRAHAVRERRNRSGTVDPAAACAVTRRRILAAFLTTYTASLIPWALAQPTRGSEHAAFLAVSAVLVGRKVLDDAQATRLYNALVQDDAGFPNAVHALLTLLDERKIDPVRLQSVLDAERSPLASLPRRIVGAWYLGIVGEGDRARVVAYESAINAAVVADVLKPPTYCYGVYGSWARKPG